MNGVYLARCRRAITPTASSCGSASRGSTGRPSVHDAAAIVQEKIGRLDEFPDFAGFLFHEVEPDAAVLDERILRAAEVVLAEASSRGRPRRSRSPSSSSATTSARSRARSTADPGRRDGLEGLAGTLREPRVARARARARSASCVEPNEPDERGDVSGTEQVHAVDAFEQRLDAFLQDRSEEARAVRVGEKETSEQAAIVARYADLFTRPQLETLLEAEEQAARRGARVDRASPDHLPGGDRHP